MNIPLTFLGLLALGGGPLARHSDYQHGPQSPAAQPVAIVLQGHGTALAGTARRPLGRSYLVYPGWSLTCAKGSKLIISYNDKSKVTVSPGEAPYVVPYVPFRSGAYDTVFVRGGLTQSAENSVFSPPEDGRVWPSHLVFRWTAFAKGSRLKLILRRFPVGIDSDETLWAKPVVEDGSGACASAEARAALTQLRDQDPSAKVQFTLAGPDDQDSVVLFGLISKDDESRIQAALDASIQDDAPFRAIERASTFQRYGLYTEAADEMEEALKAFPDNPDLRNATAQAERRTGNEVRAESLTKRLTPTHVSGH